MPEIYGQHSDELLENQHLTETHFGNAIFQQDGDDDHRSAAAYMLAFLHVD